MILAIDVGNTNVVVGVMKQGEIIAHYRMTTQIQRTSDEYGVTLLAMLSKDNIIPKDIEAIIIASVVPDIMYSLNNCMVKYFEKRPMIVGPGIKTGVSVRTDNPKEVGADRIVNCVAAYSLYGGPCIVIDFGTATTYDIVNEKGEFIAGVTSPGIRISADALWQRAAQLPRIEIKRTKGILDSKNTITSMQTGLVYGYIGQVEYIVKKAKEELACETLHVIATGGLARVILDGTDIIDHYNANLTLQGLYMIYEKNR